MSGLEKIVSSLRQKEMERLLVADGTLCDSNEGMESDKSFMFSANHESVASPDTSSAPSYKDSPLTKRRIKGGSSKSGYKYKKKHKTTCSVQATDSEKNCTTKNGKLKGSQIVDTDGLVERVMSLQGQRQMTVPVLSAIKPPKKSLTQTYGGSTAKRGGDRKSPSARQANHREFHCACRGAACYTKFDEVAVSNLRQQYQALKREELDICLAAKIEDGIHLEKVTRKTKKSVQTERKASRTDYWLFGHSICRDFFKYVHCVGQDKLTSVMKHYKKAGIGARVHKNKNRRPVHAILDRDRQYVVDFIQDYINTHAVAPVGSSTSTVPTLPKECTKLKVFELYKEFAKGSGFRIPLITSFRRIWRESFPT